MTDTLTITPDTDADLMDLEGAELGQDVEFDLIANISSPNLAFELSDDELARLGRKVVEEYEIDLESRKASGWDDRNDKAIKLAMQVKEEKTFPWPGAANIKYPLITTAAIQFAARAYPAIVDGWNVVKGKVLGEPSEEKRERAERIGQHMSWQLLEDMPEWEGDTDRLLHMLPVVGVMARKTWFDPVSGRNRTELISPDRFVVNYWAKDDCARETQEIDVYPHECLERFRSEVWREIPLEVHDDSNAPECFLEQHRLWDMDGDGYPEPYIVTVHKDTGKVVRVVARYDETGVTFNAKGEVVRIEPIRYFTKYEFIPSLDGSWYSIGFGSLLHSLNETINATINQLLDAGTLSNTQGGFLGSGVKVKSGNAGFKPGEWKKTESDGGTLRDNIVPLPVQGPNAVLFSLLGMMVEAAKDITATKDILTGETGQSNTPVGTTLAMIEQGLKVFTAIYKRVHRSLKRELGQLYRLNAVYLDEQAYFDFQDKQEAIARQDYALEGVDVIPVSDPTIVTDMQRMGRAQFLIATFRGDPNIDQRELDRRVLNAASVDDIDTLMPEPKPTPPPPEALKVMSDIAKDKAQIQIDGDKAQAENAVKYADAEEKTMRAIMADPALYEFVRSLVRQEADGADDEGGVSGMGAQPVDPQGLEGPQGPEIEPVEPMGGGEPIGPLGPDEGADMGQAVGPL